MMGIFETMYTVRLRLTKRGQKKAEIIGKPLPENDILG